jgi:hypothetical protein
MNEPDNISIIEAYQSVEEMQRWCNGKANGVITKTKELLGAL